MSAEPLNIRKVVGTPGPSQVKRASIFRARARAFIENPNRVTTIFWAAGTVVFASVLLLRHWPPRSFLALVILGGLCLTGFAIRVLAGGRLPRWTLHLDVGVATVLTSLAAAVGVTGHVDFATLYIWVALFAGLYFRPPAVLAYVCGAGAAYAVVLAFGPNVPDPAVAWLAIFGVAAVSAAVLVGLTSVLRNAAREDPLTGLPNRRSWDERLEEELERSRRTGQALSVAMIDIDDFKAVNDRSGHEAGDRLLLELASAWRAVIRGGGDFIARLGGDEFGLLAPGSDPIGIRRLIKRLGKVLPAGVVVSIGVATWDGTENASDLLRRGDQAMYQTKLRHRRGVRSI